MKHEMGHAWERYIRLMHERPGLFTQSDALSIVTDEQTVMDFSKKSGRTIGVLYESPYSLLVVDLVSDKQGRLFPYERLVPANTGAVVCVPVYDGKLVVLKQYRHALRTEQYAFPRGFGEPGLPSEENLKKEIREEIGSDLIRSAYLGQVAPDSGMLSSIVDVYYCEVTAPELKAGYEGIRELWLMEPSEFEQKMMSGEISDGFTLSAYLLYSAQK